MKKYLIKLKRTLLYRKLTNHYYLITLNVVLFILLILDFNIWYLLVIIGLNLFLLIYEIRLIFLLFALFLLCGSKILINNYRYNNIEYGDIEIQAEVIKINENNNNYKIILKKDKFKYIIYDKTNYLKVGDIITIKGNLEEGDINHTEYLFNYNKYLRNNNILGEIKDFDYRIVDHHFNFYILNTKLQNYFNLHFKGETRGYLQALVIGYKDNLKDELMNNIQNIGISHLFVISGLHMNIIMILLVFLLKLLHIPNKLHFFIIVIFFIGYYVITGGLVSIMRVLLVFIITSLNKKLKLHFSNFDVYMIAILIMLIFSPLYIFNYSFLLTYIISTSLVFINPLLKYKKIIGFFINNMLISINSIIVSLPIVISINPEINLLSIIYNLFYIPLVSYFILPISLITSIIPYLAIIYEPIINIFTKTTSILSNINFLKISFNHVNIVILILYYGLYIYIINLMKSKNNKHLLIILPFTLIISFLMTNVRYLDFYQKIIFIDLPQGESTLILDNNNKTNILIDTGENLGNDLIIYLRRMGVKRLDYVFISHGDSDHNGKLEELIKKFKIKNIVINKYDNDTFNICQKTQYKGQIIKVGRGDYLKYKNMEFKILLPDYNTLDKNNNSMVMIANIFNTKILFLGDIEKEQEKHLISLENKILVDIIKVPHHGSTTSSSEELLNNITYNYAICMSGYKNTFGFPVNSVINRYKNRCLTTSKYYTITLYKRKYQSNMNIKITNYKK